jgi:hypothetical protein
MRHTSTLTALVLMLALRDPGFGPDFVVTTGSSPGSQ